MLVRNDVVIYFADTFAGIRIGKGDRNRVKAHISGGSHLLLCVPSDEAAEARLHERFEPLRNMNHKGSASIYRREPALVNYIIALAKRGVGAPEYSDAIELPRLPFEVWAPGKFDDSSAPSDDLFTNSPLSERVRMAYDEVNHSPHSDDWHTPPLWADRAREVMGEIDLDPASCPEANRFCVKAKTFYSTSYNGLDPNHPWHGRIWLNPPYGVGNRTSAAFVARLCDEFEAGNVTEAITCIQDWSIGTAWFERLLRSSAVHFVPRGRIQFTPPAESKKDNSAPNKGNIFSYLGPNRTRFAEVFGPHGTLFRAVALPKSEDDKLK